MVSAVAEIASNRQAAHAAPTPFVSRPKRMSQF
jgi:hypothetical protein